MFGNYIFVIVRHKAQIQGEEPSLRDSQSCTQINNTIYIFGGQGDADKLFNDMYTLIFDINENNKKYIATWTLEDVVGKRPPARTSHSATAYKYQYLIIIGGEGYDDSNLIFLN
jgi:N-acetylneuraminic acid mutarotase